MQGRRPGSPSDEHYDPPSARHVSGEESSAGAPIDGALQHPAQQEGLRSKPKILSKADPANTVRSAAGAVGAIGASGVQQAPGTDIGDDSPTEALGGEEAARRIVRDRLGTGFAPKAAREASLRARGGDAASSRLAQARGAKEVETASSGMTRLRAKVRAMRMAARAAEGAASSEKAGVAARILAAANPGKALVWPLATVGAFIVLGAICLLGLSTCSGFIGGTIASLEDGVGTLEGNESDIARFFLEKGYDDIHVAAILGNLRAEAGGEPGSNFNTGAVEQGSGAGHGIAQWTGTRWNGYDSDSGIKVTSNNLLDFATSQGKEWTDLTAQLDFLWSEMQAEWSSAYTVSSGSWDPPYPTMVSGSRFRFNITGDLSDAVRQFCYGFERPGIPRISVRISFAEQYLEMLRSTSYLQAAIDIAADDSHGYSMSRRTFNPDVDCSSLVYYSLLRSGYTTDVLGGYPFTTFNMGQVLLAAGFQELPYTGMGDLLPGDILVADTHTEIYAGDGQNVGAHDDYDGVAGDSSGEEVDIGPFWDSGWHHVYRKAA